MYLCWKKVLVKVAAVSTKTRSSLIKACHRDCSSIKRIKILKKSGGKKATFPSIKYAENKKKTKAEEEIYLPVNL